MFSIILYALAAIFAAVYYFSKRKFDYWKKRNVPYLEPTPLLGNHGDHILQKKHIYEVVDENCKKFPKEPYFGTFFGTEPALVVKDPELLKLILTKQFYYFNGREVSAHIDKEVFTKNVFSSYGDDWRVIRQNVTPVFTSAKMKNMFPLITKCSHELEALIDREITNEVDARELITRFTMACFVSCGFGIDANTLGDGFENNPFAKARDSVLTPSKLLFFKITARAIWPSLFYGLGLQVMPPGFNAFFRQMMKNIFEARNYKPSTRNDFVDFILNFKNKNHITGDSITNLKTGDGQKVHLPVTEDLLVSQISIFFLAGFETSATTTSFTLFELAKHPEAQRKVQEEIDAYLKKYDNKLTYDIVDELPYTYACVEETMRLYPVLGNLTREVMEDFTLPNGLLLEKGTRIHIPTYYLHRDPKYFPEPEVYRPERFLGEERLNIVPYSYIPFGEGPRLCLGMRFAKMQVLAGLVTVLKKCSLSVADNTPRYPKMNGSLVVPMPIEPIKLKVTPRNEWENRRYVKV